MQLSARPGALPPVEDLASALRTAADRLGHRPAVTVLRADRRDEQGFRSLLRWAAKGSHLLDLEAGLAPGDRLLLAAPPGWVAAAVCCAAWWAGVTVTTDGPADVAVIHDDAPARADAAAVYAVGDAVDGSPAVLGGAEPWVVAVQAFPDQPPAPGAAAEATAAAANGRSWSHAELLAAARRWDADGPLGLVAGAPPEVWLPALVRPLVTGHATVVLAGAGRGAADAEGVVVWP